MSELIPIMDQEVAVYEKKELIPITSKEVAVDEKAIVQISLKSDRALEQAKALKVTNQEEYNEAEAFLKVVKTLENEYDDLFDPNIKRAYESHKSAVALKKKLYVPLLEAEKIIKPKMTSLLKPPLPA